MFLFLIFSVWFTTNLYALPGDFGIYVSQDVEDQSYQLNLATFSSLDESSSNLIYGIEFLTYDPFIKPYPKMRIVKKIGGVLHQQTFSPVIENIELSSLSLQTWSHKLKIFWLILFYQVTAFLLKNFDFINKDIFKKLEIFLIESILLLILVLGICETSLNAYLSVKNKINLHVLKKLNFSAQKNIQISLSYSQLQDLKFINRSTLRKVFEKNNLGDDVLNVILEFIKFSPTKVLAEVIKSSNSKPLLIDSHKCSKNIMKKYLI